jgi:hypothetical protein
MTIMAHAHCMLYTSRYKNTLAVCNTYCFPTARTVAERATMLRYTYNARLAIIMHVILLTPTAYRLNYVYSNNFMQCFMLAE